MSEAWTFEPAATNSRVPILMYHEVSPDPVPGFRKYTVVPTEFSRQMALLRWSGFTAIGFDTLLEHRVLGTPLPPNPVIITFDDGFEGCAEFAAPILAAHGFTATFYLVSGLMGEESEWLVRERGISLPLMRWSTARELNALGFTLGGHTITHPYLSELSRDHCRDQVKTGREMLQDRLGIAVDHFAYPFGSHNEDVREVTAEAGYRTACTVRRAISQAGDHLLALPRIPVNGADSLTSFVKRLGMVRAAGDEVRRRTRRLAIQVAQWGRGANRSLTEPMPNTEGS